ncbi:MAG: helix-turn-helix transcriptional regulator [Myxococcales bacterium]|nr:helix-turn-helix transcriptional regulator [Myxococcales bacterium]
MVGDNLRRLADAKGQQLHTLADFADVSRSQMYDVANGTKAATTDWLARVAAALEVEPCELLKPRSP